MADAADDDWAKQVADHLAQMRVKNGDSTAVASGATETTPTTTTTDKPVTDITADDEKPDAAKESLLSKLLATKLTEVKHQKLEVQQKDPNSPYFAARSFEDLPLTDKLKKGLREMGFMKPSRIQETALPMLLNEKRENMIAQSQSGTGKTAAFSLTVLSRIDINVKEPQALILSPTYELALQTGLVVEKMGRFIGENLIAYAVKGNRLERGYKLPQPIIIGTPGTVLDWITRSKAFDPKKIQVLVFDEADVMISTQGHKDQSTRIKRSMDLQTTQCLLFSATYDDKVMKFAQTIVKDPNIIKLKREEESLDNIRQFKVHAESDAKKLSALFNIYGVLGAGQAIIFCRTRKSATYVAKTMNAQGFAVALLSGELDVSQRADVIRRFQQGLERVLVSTNVTARGIDVEQVTMVVNFDLPDMKDDVTGHFVADCETYLHRIGRTGRFGKSGIAINMLSSEKDDRILKKIESHFGRKCESLDTEDVDDLEDKLNE